MEQVGVKQPGTPKTATFLPLKSSDPVRSTACPSFRNCVGWLFVGGGGFGGGVGQAERHLGP